MGLWIVVIKWGRDMKVNVKILKEEKIIRVGMFRNIIVEEVWWELSFEWWVVLGWLKEGIYSCL